MPELGEERVDLDFIKDKLKQRLYEGMDEFNRDMQLMFDQWLNDNG